MSSLQDYAAFVGQGAIDELSLLAARLGTQRVRCINATRLGGGVAEILTRMVPLCQELGVDLRWDVLEGTEPFYRVTKTIHNALHGQAPPWSAEMQQVFDDVTEHNAARLTLAGDIFFIHDPQPIGLIRRKPALGGRWIWRCHIDLSRPNPAVWNFLRPFILDYDSAVFSSPAFAQQLPMRQLLIAPSIDPLSEKNRPMEPEEIQQVLRRLEIPTDLPLVTQVSRFDYLKDPLGVIDAFMRVRRSVKCRLVLLGGPASDDPEGAEVLAKVRDRVRHQSDIHVLLLPPTSHLEVNAVQRASTVLVQKSLREGFGLTVSEALWKAKPVVASAVGGIPLQVKHGSSGLLVHSVEGAAHAITQLLRNPSLAAQLGSNGREHVRQNFLLTRHLRDYLTLFLTTGFRGDVLRLNGASATG